MSCVSSLLLKSRLKHRQDVKSVHILSAAIPYQARSCSLVISTTIHHIKGNKMSPSLSLSSLFLSTTIQDESHSLTQHLCLINYAQGDFY